MKLTGVQIRNFRNILDSGEALIQNDVTCLVGKNESGKTAFLHALHRLRPAEVSLEFDLLLQYPAWLEKLHRIQGRKLGEVRPVRATFEFEAVDIDAVRSQFGPSALKSNKVVLERQYDGKRLYQLTTDEAAVVSHIIQQAGLLEPLSQEAQRISTLEALKKFIETLKGRTEDAGAAQAAAALEKEISARLGSHPVGQAIYNFIEPRIPKFFYYDEYSQLPGEIKISRVLQADESQLNADERTARSLLQLAAAASDYLINPDYERRKRELENVANGITKDVLKYWTQNPHLRVLIDITQRTEATPQGQTTVLEELKIRVYDDIHWLSLPFSEHSSGFRWFFSFLAAFSAYERAKAPVVILLDEPGLGLHGRAQKDFLRFIDERLAARHQVIYTTHSPFMVQPDKLERVRIVEDKGTEIGAVVSQDVLTMDPDTLFPLLGALGYDLAQHLLIGPNNIIVEGTADFTYLAVLSGFLKEQGGHGLDDKWTIVPVGGADLIPTFVALLGNKLDVTVVVDARTEQHQRLARLAREGYLAHQRIVALGEVFDSSHTNIEDVFAVDDYLVLFNKAFGTSVAVSDLRGTDSIVDQLARLQGADFDHGKPADVLLRQRDHLLPGFRAETLSRFEHLFERINKTLA